MSLEPRSSPKTLLKLLLSKTSEVLEQSKDNETAIQQLEREVRDNKDKLILIIKQLELVTGDMDYGTN